MPTIKHKVEMNLPQLIEWLFSKRNLDDGIFLSNKHNSVHVTDDGILEFFGTFYDDIFTVEVEEPITENTVFDKLISRYVFISSKPSYAHSINTSIKEVIEDRKVATHIYLENEDNELQLIWRNGKLVE